MNPFLAFGFAAALSLLASVPASASDTPAAVRVRPEQVRAFAPETAQSVVVREGRGRYRRVSTQADCPALLEASRLAFQVGTLLTGVDSGGRTIATTDRAAVPPQISGTTPHAALVVIQGERREACPIAGVVAVDAAAFDAAARRHGSRDNRYGG